MIESAYMAPDQKNLIFCNLFYSGASAIVPMLECILPILGFNVTDYGPEATQKLLDDPPVSPYFHWTHHPPEFFEPFFEQDSIKVVFLHRDPRDVAVSYAADHIHRGLLKPDNLPALLRHMPQMTEAENFKAACRWVDVSCDQPVKIIRFDDLKRDTVAVVLDVLTFYGVGLTEELAQSIQLLHEAKFSFEAMTGRQRGESGATVRTRYIARKGISGEWREKFDDETQAVWQQHLGSHMKFLGYGT